MDVLTSNFGFNEFIINSTLLFLSGRTRNTPSESCLRGMSDHLLSAQVCRNPDCPEFYEALHWSHHINYIYWSIHQEVASSSDALIRDLGL